HAGGQGHCRSERQPHCGGGERTSAACARRVLRANGTFPWTLLPPPSSSSSAANLLREIQSAEGVPSPLAGEGSAAPQWPQSGEGSGRSIPPHSSREHGRAALSRKGRGHRKMRRPLSANRRFVTSAAHAVQGALTPHAVVAELVDALA